MAIIKPVNFTSIEDAEVQRDRPVTQETVRKMIQNSNLLGSLAVIGSIAHIQLNMPGVPTVNPDIFQFSNGSEITNEFSPLKSVAPNNYFTPNMTSKYVRGAEQGSGNNGTGGDATVNLSHSHTLGPALVFASCNDGNDAPVYEGPPHTHPVFSNFSSAEPLEPAHQELAVYLKIN